LLQVGADPGRLGLATVEALPEVNLVTIPDLVYLTDNDLSLQSAQAQMLFHCQKMGDRFALLDIPRQREPAKALEWTSRIADEELSRYGAIYYPWLSFARDGQIRLSPPSGAVAGLIARSERLDGAGRAPANLQLKGAVGVEWDLDAVMQGELNLAGINCIRKFEAGALRLWGARTLSREEDYLYVHNRRVILLAIKSMTSGLRWAVFEPNNQNLQQRIKDSLDGFLRGMLARGLTAGQSPEESYYVRVIDGTAGDSSQVVAEIGIAWSRPAEFIVITIKRSPEILTLVEDDA
jgi:phage tail sheath protein FI